MCGHPCRKPESSSQCTVSQRGLSLLGSVLSSPPNPHNATEGYDVGTSKLMTLRFGACGLWLGTPYTFFSAIAVLPPQRRTCLSISPVGDLYAHFLPYRHQMLRFQSLSNCKLLKSGYCLVNVYTPVRVLSELFLCATSGCFDVSFPPQLESPFSAAFDSASLPLP